MSKYLTGIGIGFLVPLALWTGLFYVQLGAPTESSRWIYECTQIKRRIVDAQIGQGRLLVVAGSNGLFGVRAQDIEKALGVPAVNLSTHAGLGLRFILSQAKTIARRGDIVVLALEYDHYQYDDDERNVFYDYVTARAPAYFKSLRAFGRARFILAVSVRRLCWGLRGVFVEPTRKTTGYQSETLNDHGDETKNHHLRRPEMGIAVLKRLKPETLKLNQQAASWVLLREFVGWCDAAGVDLLVTYPSYAAFPEYTTAPQRGYYESVHRFWGSTGVITLGEPWDWMYPKEQLYDTRYHLNDLGMSKRTNQLIGCIRSAIPDRLQILKCVPHADGQ